MQQVAASRLSLRKKRHAFTLVELMVVTVIVVILAGLVAGVVVKAVDASRTTSTLTTMEILKSGLNKQVQEIVDAAKRSPDSSPELIYAKLRQVFPATISPAHPAPPGPFILGEAKRGCTITLQPAYPPYEKMIPVALINSFPSQEDQQKLKSILLRMIIEKGPKSKVEVDQLPKGSLGKVSIAGADFDAVLDSWGDPIGLDILYSNQAKAETAKPVITISSPNAVMKN
jgi:prepilin-type N-terminal cleavage/methylation domain-containing protein